MSKWSSQYTEWALKIPAWKKVKDLAVFDRMNSGVLVQWYTDVDETNYKIMALQNSHFIKLTFLLQPYK